MLRLGVYLFLMLNKTERKNNLKKEKKIIFYVKACSCGNKENRWSFGIIWDSTRRILDRQWSYLIDIFIQYWIQGYLSELDI